MEADALEEDFDEHFSDEEFTDPLKKHKEFLKFLDSLN